MTVSKSNSASISCPAPESGAADNIRLCQYLRPYAASSCILISRAIVLFILSRVELACQLRPLLLHFLLAVCATLLPEQSLSDPNRGSFLFSWYSCLTFSRLLRSDSSGEGPSSAPPGISWFNFFCTRDSREMSRALTLMEAFSTNADYIGDDCFARNVDSTTDPFLRPRQLPHYLAHIGVFSSLRPCRIRW